MKKILFLLLSTVAMYGQVPADATPLENIQITNNVENTTPAFIGVQETNGVINKIPSAYIEKTENKISTITGYSETLYPNEKATHDGLDLKLNISDLPTNLTLYPTTAVSDVAGYVKMVTDIHDVDYNTVAVDVSTPLITTTNQLISSRISADGVLIGQPGVFNITTFGNIRHLSGSGTASFYFEVYQRTSAGVETLICTSSNSLPVTNGGYSEFSASGVWDDGDFLATDRIVIKSYANRIVGGSDPIYQFQFGGASPVRTILPVPFSVVDAGYEVKINKVSTLTASDVLYPNNNAVIAGLATKFGGSVTTNTIPLATGVNTFGNSTMTQSGGSIVTSSDFYVNNNIRIGRGSGNTASNLVLGESALFSNTTGSDLIAIGTQALRSNLSGIRNTAVGTLSLFGNTIGSNNLGIGRFALISNTTGSNNIGLGSGAGTFISDGITTANILNNSILIGNNTKPLADNQTNQIIIANEGIGLGSNTTVIGNSSTSFGRFWGKLLVGKSTNDGINDIQANSFISSGATTLGASQPTANNQVTRKDYVDTGLALKADITNAILRTGDQSGITGTKSFVNSSIGYSILIDNPSTGVGLQVNNGNGTGLSVINPLSGQGLLVNSEGTGNGIISNMATAGTGFNYVGQNNGVNTFTVDKLGNIIGNNYTGSAALTGIPTAPTAAPGTNTTQIATTAFVSSLDAGNVKLTGSQTVTGAKLFSNNVDFFAPVSLNSPTSVFSDLIIKSNNLIKYDFDNDGGVDVLIGRLGGEFRIQSLSTDAIKLMSTNAGIKLDSGNNGFLNLDSSGVVLNANTNPNGIIINGGLSSTTVKGINVNIDANSGKTSLINGVVYIQEYTVATLPTPTTTAYATVTDATAPTYLGALTGGGTVKCPVFFNGTIWVSH